MAGFDELLKKKNTITVNYQCSDQEALFLNKSSTKKCLKRVSNKSDHIFYSFSMKNHKKY